MEECSQIPTQLEGLKQAKIFKNKNVKRTTRRAK